MLLICRACFQNLQCFLDYIAVFVPDAEVLRKIPKVSCYECFELQAEIFKGLFLLLFILWLNFLLLSFLKDAFYVAVWNLILRIEVLKSLILTLELCTVLVHILQIRIDDNLLGSQLLMERCVACGVKRHEVIRHDTAATIYGTTHLQSLELERICKDKGISLEAEVGAIGGEEDGVVGMGECADPDECKAIADCGVDMLACGIGNIHGVYPEGWPGLRFDVLDAIIAKVGEDLPLVLHGGSGIPDAMVQEAVRKGVSKINVNTELQLVFAAKTREYIEAGKDKEGKGFDPRKLLAPGTAACVDMVKYKIDVFGSTNKA